MCDMPHSVQMWTVDVSVVCRELTANIMKGLFSSTIVYCKVAADVQSNVTKLLTKV